MTEHEIPTTLLNALSTDTGFFPAMGVHVDGPVLAISPSRSRWVVAVFAFAASAALLSVPLIPFQWVFVLPLLLGAFVSVVIGPHFARRFGTEMRIDPESQIVSITRRSSVNKIPFEKVIAFQLLPKGGRGRAGQLNLIYHEAGGPLTRTCLMCHRIQYYLVRAAHKLAAHSHWPVLDHNNREISAASRSAEVHN